eukprot:6214305-Pleurochrysis_carterae.AAC.3
MTRLIYRIFPNSRSKAARGPSRSSRPTLWNHACLSWRVLTSSDSLPRIYQSDPPGGQEAAKLY